MMSVSLPSHCQGCWNRVWALDNGVPCSCAGYHVRPASVLTSTRVIFPRPLHASPLIGHQPAPGSFCGYDGDVMMDFASMSKLKMRAFSPGSGSVYFDVSHRVMKGSAASSIRRSHFTFVLPSKPGSRRRIG